MMNQHPISLYHIRLKDKARHRYPRKNLLCLCSIDFQCGSFSVKRRSPFHKTRKTPTPTKLIVVLSFTYIFLCRIVRRQSRITQRINKITLSPIFSLNTIHTLFLLLHLFKGFRRKKSHFIFHFHAETVVMRI